MYKTHEDRTWQLCWSADLLEPADPFQQVDDLCWPSKFCLLRFLGQNLLTSALAAAEGFSIQDSLSSLAFSLAKAFLCAGPSSCWRNIASLLKDAWNKIKHHCYHTRQVLVTIAIESKKNVPYKLDEHHKLRSIVQIAACIWVHKELDMNLSSSQSSSSPCAQIACLNLIALKTFGD